MATEIKRLVAWPKQFQLSNILLYRHQRQSRIEDETDYCVSVKKNSSEHNLKIAISFLSHIALDLAIPFGGGGLFVSCIKECPKSPRPFLILSYVTEFLFDVCANTVDFVQINLKFLNFNCEDHSLSFYHEF